MSGMKGRGLGIAIGAIIAVFGVVIGFGVIPGLVVVGSPTSVAEFSYTTSAGNNLTLVDHSSLPGGKAPGGPSASYALISITVTWGDGAAPLIQHSFGFTATHQYASSATYPVAEAVLYSICVAEHVGGPTCSDSTSVAATTVQIGTCAISYAAGGCHRGQGGTSSVSVHFSYTESAGGVLSVTDTTTSINATINSVTFSWGDNSANFTSAVAGASASHVYTLGGLYIISDVVKWQPIATNGIPANIQTSGNATELNISTTQNCGGVCVNGNTGGASSGLSFTASGLALALIGFGVIFALLSAFNMDLERALLLGLVAAAIAGAVGVLTVGAL
jgi:hypothetical protein